jgi:hypothetical protein
MTVDEPAVVSAPLAKEADWRQDRNSPIWAEIDDGSGVGHGDPAPAEAVADQEADASLEKAAKPFTSHDGEVLMAVVRGAEFPDDLMRGVIEYAERGTHTNEELAALDSEQTPACLAELRQLWGADSVRGNLHLVERFLDARLPRQVAQGIRDARLADGRALFNDAASITRLYHLAKKSGVNVDAPRLTASDTKTEIAAIEKRIRTDRKAYDRDEALQARCRQLLSASRH